jgi:ABC-type multidrug transport system fused ATPase/permease subunit
VVALAVLQAATLGAFLVLLRDIVDVLGTNPGNRHHIYRSVGLLAAVVLLHALLRGIEFSVSERMGFELIRRLRMTMYEHLQGMSVRQLQGRSRGGLLLRFTGDLSMLRTWVSRGFARGLVSLIVLAGGLIVVGMLDVRLAVTIGAVLSFGAAASALFGPKLNRLTRAVRRKRSLLTGNITEQINSLGVVQVFGRSAGEHSRLSRQNDSLTSSLLRTASVRGWMLSLASATGWLAIAAVLFVGAVDVMAGNTSVGVMVSAVVASRQLTNPVRRLGLSYDYWQRAQVSRSKVLDFLNSSSRPLDDPTLETLRVGRGQIEFRNASVTGALDHVHATIGGGQVVAIMGPTGAGKSTLLNVVSGLQSPDDGSVLVDDQPLSERTLRSRFARVGVVAPDLPLMRGTVRRNLMYRNPSATEAELRRVILACDLENVIVGLSGGLDTWLTEGGRNLSSGERQRIALARALLGNPPILLLDEPTSGVDEASKEVFRRIITHHRGTVLLVTHDPAEARLADEIWLMEAGRIRSMTSGDRFRNHLWSLGNRAAQSSSEMVGVRNFV